MTTQYTCDLCKKVFTQKIDFTRHTNRKAPCITLEKMHEITKKIEQTSDTIRITTVDSFPTIVHDSIVWTKYFTTKDTIIHYKTVYVPKTRYQTRIEYKTIYKQLKAETKQHKQTMKTERKSEFPWRLVFVIAILALLIILTFKYLPK